MIILGSSSSRGRPRLANRVILAGILQLVVACSGGDDGPGPRRLTPLQQLDELHRVKASPQRCGDNADCPTGSYCDETTAQCDWACSSDDGCGEGFICSDVGTCIAGVAFIPNSDATCALTSADDRRTALLALAAKVDKPSCGESDNPCICGAYCSGLSGSVCTVECLPPGLDSPAVPSLTCATGQVCTDYGRCVPSGAPPPPAPRPVYTVQVDAAAFSDKSKTAVTHAVKVRLATSDLATVAAQVPMRIVAAGTFAPDAPRPLVTCVADGTPAPDCVLDGWSWTGATTGEKTFWIVVPPVAEATSWTVEARTDASRIPGKVTVESIPFDIPEQDPGRYRGTMRFRNDGSANADADDLTVPVEVLVTPHHVVVLEPTRVLLPAGQLAMSRDPGKATMIPWLTAGTEAYDVRFDLGQMRYDSHGGTLDADLTFTTGDGNGARTVAMSLAYQDLPPMCFPLGPSCAAGTTCDLSLRLCLPAPLTGNEIVDDLSADSTPSGTLASPLYDRWQPALAPLIAASGGNLGGDHGLGLERAYCFSHPSQTGPGGLDYDAPLTALTSDRPCRAPGAGVFAQETFPIFDRATEYETDGDVVTFDLFAACLAELDAQPGDDPLERKTCASLARVFLALDANAPAGVGQAGSLYDQRLLFQVLRQWMGLQSYVASTAVRVQEFAGAVGTTAESLDTTLARVEDGLRVLLDPRVRGQYRSGGDLLRTVHAPDYRLQPRPYERWSFNDRAALGHEQERGADLSIHGADGEYVLSCDEQGEAKGTSYFHDDPMVEDDTRFSISLRPTFVSYHREDDVLTLFHKGSDDPGGPELWLRAHTVDPDAATRGLVLVLEDNDHGKVVFPAIEGDGRGDWGLLAVVADGAGYKLYQRREGRPSIVATGTIPEGFRDVIWGKDGPVELNCAPPLANACPSWDRYAAGDGLAAPGFVNATEAYRFRQLTSACAPAAQNCNAIAASRRAYWLSTALAGVPAAVAGQFTVATGPSQALSCTPVLGGYEITYLCPLTLTQFPLAANTSHVFGDGPRLPLPICGGPVPYTDGIVYDEVSLWNRALSLAEFDKLADRYAGDPRNEVLPALPGGALPRNEQEVGLPAHLVEAAAADLELLGAYVTSQRGAIYGECVDPQSIGAARDAVVATVGRHLRLVTLLEGEAAYLAELPGVESATWHARYQDGRRQLAGRRAAALRGLRDALACQNPLGISEQDIPLYTGSAASLNDRGYATTRFLLGEARDEVDDAIQARALAETAYLQQRREALQQQMDATTKSKRLAGLKAEHEGVLRKLCGAPANPNVTYLASFLNRSLDASRCFFKEEQSCRTTYAGAPVENVPPSCVRGELGSAFLAVQSAALDVDHAIKAVDRAEQSYDAQMQFCTDLSGFNTATQAMRVVHNAHMLRLAERRRKLGLLKQAADDMVSNVLFAGSGGTMGRPAIDFGITYKISELDKASLVAQTRFDETLAARAHLTASVDCFARADLQRFSADAQRDLVKRAMQNAHTALSNLESSVDLVHALVDDAGAEIHREETLVQSPPQFHYWLGQHIADYQNYMRHARRLSYLTLRALEYEQNGWVDVNVTGRTSVLTATRAEQLGAVLDDIDAYSQPTNAVRTVQGKSMTLSWRDAILKIPATPGKTPTQKLREFLLSDEAKIYRPNGTLLGRGIRFTLRGNAYTDNKCGERLWRVIPAVAGVNAVPSDDLIIRQMNSVASNPCGEGDPIFTRIQPQDNLLRGEASAVSPPSFLVHPEFAEMTINPIPGTQGELDLSQAQDVNNSWPGTFGGRGLYGDYVLIFPAAGFPPSRLATITDAYLRFDFVYFTDTNGAIP